MTLQCNYDDFTSKGTSLSFTWLSPFDWTIGVQLIKCIYSTENQDTNKVLLENYRRLDFCLKYIIALLFSVALSCTIGFEIGLRLVSWWIFFLQIFVDPQYILYLACWVGPLYPTVYIATHTSNPLADIISMAMALM